jgi:hypothetical protein
MKSFNMKTKILIVTKMFFMLLISCCLFSCTQKEGNSIKGDTNYSVVIIDGCEYLRKYEGYHSGYSFSHKGNCKNPIHYKVIYDTVHVR